MLAWHKHAGELTLHHSGITLQLTNTLGSPQAFLRRPHSVSGFSSIVVAVDTALKPGARWDGSKFRRLSSWRRKEIFHSPIRTKQERLSSWQAQLPALSPSHWLFINLFHVTSDAVGRLGIDEGLPYSQPPVSRFSRRQHQDAATLSLRHVLSCILQGTRLIMEPSQSPTSGLPREHT